MKHSKWLKIRQGKVKRSTTTRRVGEKSKFDLLGNNIKSKSTKPPRLGVYWDQEEVKGKCKFLCVWLYYIKAQNWGNTINPYHNTQGQEKFFIHENMQRKFEIQRDALGAERKREGQRVWKTPSGIWQSQTSKFREF